MVSFVPLPPIMRRQRYRAFSGDVDSGSPQKMRSNDNIQPMERTSARI
jgi:hypothetical protein